MVLLWEVCSESMFQVQPVCRMLLWSPPWSVKSAFTNFGGTEGPFVVLIYHVYHSLLEC